MYIWSLLHTDQDNLVRGQDISCVWHDLHLRGVHIPYVSLSMRAFFYRIETRNRRVASTRTPLASTPRGRRQPGPLSSQRGRHVNPDPSRVNAAGPASTRTPLASTRLSRQPGPPSRQRDRRVNPDPLASTRPSRQPGPTSSQRDRRVILKQS